MKSLEPRRILFLEPARQRYRLRLLAPSADLLLLGGEALCHVLLSEVLNQPQARNSLVVARGPVPFLPGNKTTVGYISPLTGLPHYSFVGGRACAELLNLGLDAIVLVGDEALDGVSDTYAVIAGRAPELAVTWQSGDELPSGQREAYYWLLAHELGGRPGQGSIFALGEGARLGYRTANLGVDGLYHAGRGGAGGIFARLLAALVLRGDPIDEQAWFGPRAEAFWDLREGEIRQRLDTYTDRLARRDGGTVTKLYATGRGESPTLPTRNAQRLGYNQAHLGARRVLKASREGQTGCHWCPVSCRHWHWVKAGYAPGERDQLLDDFEPTYALFAMLDLQSGEDSTRGALQLRAEVDQRLVLPIEQMGCDVIDVGLALAALFEGLERDLIPLDHVPPFLRAGPYLGQMDIATRAVAALRNGEPWPALRTVGDGPQALGKRYPALQDLLFTCGPGTLGNAGHANHLWTFLMPVSRYFGHYVGQLYKIEAELPDSPDKAQALFRNVIRQALKREFFGVLCNSLSACAFTFVIFAQEGQSLVLDESDLLVRTLACYGIETHREALAWFAEAFWARSVALRLKMGWRPPAAADYPERVFEALSQALNRPVPELRLFLDQLIAEWKRQAAEILYKYGYEPLISWEQ